MSYVIDPGVTFDRMIERRVNERVELMRRSTCADCERCELPRTFGLPNVDIGWCRENGEFVDATEPLAQNPCDVFFKLE